MPIFNFTDSGVRYWYQGLSWMQLGSLVDPTAYKLAVDSRDEVQIVFSK